MQEEHQVYGKQASLRVCAAGMIEKNSAGGTFNLPFLPSCQGELNGENHWINRRVTSGKSCLLFERKRLSGSDADQWSTDTAPGGLSTIVLV